MRLLIACGLAAILIAESRAGEIRPLMKEVARQILHDGAPGVSIAVVADGQTYFYNAGTTGRNGRRVTNRTLFETASITKIFTTTLLGIDVARGDKSLGDPITTYLPGYPLRTRLRAATLEMLGTFTAGLPEAPPDYLTLPPADRGIAFYPVERFLSFVNRWQPARRLPTPRSYADASVGLLGLCLGGLSLDTWEHRLDTEIFDPLGMFDTVLRPNADQEHRMARGRYPDGSRAPRWKVDAMAPSDGLKSTSADLARFLQASLGGGLSSAPDLESGMEIATHTGFMVHLKNGREFQALAWRLDPLVVGHRNYWVATKSGGVPGFSSKISYNRDLGIGVAILTNVSQLNLGDLELGLMKKIAQAR